MNNQLTTHQKARIFALYIGQPLYKKSPDCAMLPKDWVQTQFWSICKEHIHFLNPCSCTDKVAYEDAQLLLRPLNAISDEDAINVAKITYPPDIAFKSVERGYIAVNVVSTGGGYIVRIGSGSYFDITTNTPRGDTPLSSLLTILVSQFLRQRGYALPEFIAPGHPDNGKTAIELGLAIDITKQETPA